MGTDQGLQRVFQRVEEGLALDRNEIRALLEVQPHSQDAGLIMGTADRMNRELTGNRGEVHAQVGINVSPCPNDCAFCSFASANGLFRQASELPAVEVGRRLRAAWDEGANALYLMVTGDYDFDRFLDVVGEVRGALPDEAPLVANIMDFGPEQARLLRAAGITGIYHAMRVGEGRDTRLQPDVRLATMRAAFEAGLMVGTCVEPVGPEHTTDELAYAILAGRTVPIRFSGAMRRVNVPGSPLAKHGTISEYRLAFLVAVTRLAMGRHVPANCTHEPNMTSASAGANVFWAEAGSNPRDTCRDTAKGRGMEVAACIAALKEADYEVRPGRSRIFA